MRKTVGTTVALVFGVLFAAGPVLAAQVIVTKIDKNTDGTSTYHFAIRTDKSETFTPGTDFVTVYNFSSLVDGSPKSPPGWQFSSEDYGKTPTWGGYPAVMPVDIPGFSNLTWTATKAVAGGSEISGFTATTRAKTTTEGEYSAQVSVEEPTGTGSSKSSKQAVIGTLPTPAFLSQ